MLYSESYLTRDLLDHVVLFVLSGASNVTKKLMQRLWLSLCVMGDFTFCFCVCFVLFLSPLGACFKAVPHFCLTILIFYDN